MGPPRTRAQRLAAQQAARSRFHEGSMNDRVSAAPPVAFLFGPGEREALEQPVFGFGVVGASSGQAVDEQQRRLGGDDDERRNGGFQHQQQQTLSQQQQSQPPQLQQQPPPPPQDGRRKALLGQMWEGLRGRLRLRRDPAAENNDAATTGRKRRAESRDDTGSSSNNNAQATMPPPSTAEIPGLGLGDRPTREEVYANYHQLVASGFFSSHAIHSTRQPGPSQRPATSHDARSPNHVRHDPPQWPLAVSPAPGMTTASTAMLMTPPRGPSPICSPASAASSRGTKRAAEDDDDDVDIADQVADTAMRGDGQPPAATATMDHAGEDASTLAHRFLPKRLRKSASRDISLPKLRAVATRRGLAGGRRSISMVAEVGSGRAAAPEQQHQNHHHAGANTKHSSSGGNKLAKRVPGSSFPNTSILPTDPSSSSLARASLDVVQQQPPAPRRQQQTQSLRGRHAGDDAAVIMPGAFFAGGSSNSSSSTAKRQTSSRSLRCKAAAMSSLSSAAAHAIPAAESGPLSVVPDANRGIPDVPAIPAKFTYGEDRENGVPWRGLRR
ncbi:hypothetical protein VFPBJ_05465 [Purpureocillium lilacinum]|uniref:Uncharacterized protein n=1 Tax=Purpureocillium lilacinum TaxID=33203 RepID=A0A179GRA3_PURLI|nr:hypothetical protein VFPBJ_05465 [Purpureocillium lilacinum]